MTPENSTAAPEYFLCDDCAAGEDLNRTGALNSPESGAAHGWDALATDLYAERDDAIRRVQAKGGIGRNANADGVLWGIEQCLKHLEYHIPKHPNVDSSDPAHKTP